MIFRIYGKCLSLILAPVLMIAIMGAPVFSSVLSLRSELFEGKLHNVGGFFSSISVKSDWLAEKTTVVQKSGGRTYAPLRHEGLRLFMPLSFQSAVKKERSSMLNSNVKSSYFDIKNTILLKLRI